MTQPKTFNDAYIRLVRVLFYSDLHGTRCILALAEVIWSITLFLPGETFSRPTYHVMAQVASENAWGVIFAISAITQISILVKGEYHSTFSTVFAGWNSVLWSFVVISMYLSISPVPAAISGETALAIGAAWIWIRSGLKLKGLRANDYGC
jgi:hypothetical protein